MHILFVEDDEALRYAIAREMCAHGHGVLEARSASEALSQLGEHPVDALVTDISLPGISGEVLAAEVRSLRPLVKVVFATGQPHIKDPAAADEVPRLVRKPYSWQALEAALEDVPVG